MNGLSDHQFVVNLTYFLYLVGDCGSYAFEFFVGYLACKQNNAVVAVDVDTGLGESVIGFADVDGYLGFNDLIVDVTAKAAAAGVVLYRAFMSCAEDLCAGRQADAKRYTGQKPGQYIHG